jgi:peptidoglycan/LPS O-acetylase OafA/YrhL
MLLVLALHAGALPGGFLGVDVFFVLSGYLITRLLLAEHDRAGRIAVGGFYWRRFRRLAPPLVLMLGVYLLVAPWVWPGEAHAREASLAALYVTDYIKAPHLAHTWSLGVEEKFYLAWPLVLIAALRRWPLDRVARGLLVAIAVAVLWRAGVGDYYRFDCRLPGLLIGCWIAVAKPVLPSWAGWAGAALLAYAVLVSDIHPEAAVTLSIPLAEIAALGLVGAATTLPLRSPALVQLGKLSYGIYLWHYPMSLALRYEYPWWFTLPVVLLASTAAAWVSSVTIERLRA